CAQCRRCAAHHRRARRRRLFGRRARPRREGPGQDPRLHRCGEGWRAHACGAGQSHEPRMTVQQLNSFRTGPDERGHFGLYGGRFVAETLMPLILELEAAYAEAKNDAGFRREMDAYLKDYVGRPTPLYFAERLTEHLRKTDAANGGSGGAKIY